MTFTLKTFTVKNVLEALNANAAATLHFKEKKPKEGAKWRPGVGYMNITLQVSPNDPPCAASVYARDVVVARGPANPADENNGYDKKNTNECVSIISYNHSNGYGEMIEKVEAERNRRIAEMQDKGEIRGWKDQKHWPMVSTVYSDKAREEYAGKPYTDPKDSTKTDKRINMVMDFSTFPNESYIPSEKRGKPKCVVKDFRTGRLNKETGRIEYDLLTVDGQPVNAANAYRVIRSGAVFVEMYAAFDTTSKSQFGVSTRQIIQEVVVDPVADSNSGDIEMKDNSDLLARIEAMKKAAQVSVNATGGAVSANAVSANANAADAADTVSADAVSADAAVSAGAVSADAVEETTSGNANTYIEEADVSSALDDI